MTVPPSIKVTMAETVPVPARIPSSFTVTELVFDNLPFTIRRPLFTVVVPV